MPIFTSAHAFIPVTSLPRSFTRPAEGRKVSVITLKSVVLPAPLGPMKPQMCFSGMSKLTSFNAATPPKYFVSAVASRIFTTSPGFYHGRQPSQQSDQAIGLEKNDQY